MKTTLYSGLFEDEISEILRELPDNAIIKCQPYSYIKMLGALYEDGLIESTNGKYYHKYCGRENYGHIHIKQLINTLSHTNFTVTVR